MDKKLKISLFFFLFSFVFVSFALFQDKNNRKIEKSHPTDNNSKIILFYGDGCPHCEEVEKFIKDRGIEEKVSFFKKEIYHNEQNKNELLQVVKNCGLDVNTVGIPFLQNGTECLLGQEKILEFFKQKSRK
jgi:hypothetical protein